MSMPIPVYGLLLSDLQRTGWYTRPLEMRPSAADKPVMWDVVSDAPMSTEHSNARFFVPLLAKSGWAMFTDGDMLFRSNVNRLFDNLDQSKAVYCVQHDHNPTGAVKMDGQVQTKYHRKNWSSVIIFNCDHPANLSGLTLDMLNTTPGRDLHRLCWLDDNDIGELDQSWNYLVGYTRGNHDAKIAHFTEGVPDMAGYDKQLYADEWFDVRNAWARGGPDAMVDRWATATK